MTLRLAKSTVVMLAFASVYVVWGSTYLAIHVAGEHLPAPVVSASRSLISTAMMFGICRGAGRSLRVPAGEGWKLALIGLLFMSGNNMLLTWGEQMVPTGFASLIVSTMPIMVAALEMMLPAGERLNRRGWTGTLLGSAGIAILVSPSLHRGVAAVGYSRPLRGTLALLGAAGCFAVGSVLSRRFRFQANTFVATGWQIAAGACFNSALVLATGGLHRAVWTWHGLEAILYLSVFGTLFGLVAFTYLLQNVAVTKVSTYAFVNPVIAVLLGVLVLGERLVPAQIGGMAVILCAVALVIYSRVDRNKTEIVGTAGNAVE